MQMEQNPEYPAYLSVGTEVSAKYKGAFCEAKIKKVVRNIKCKVAYKQAGLGIGNISDDQIKGLLRVGATVEVKHPDKRDQKVEATILKIQDCSQYTVVFDDGDITTLRRSALHLKSGRHFNESETLDQLPLTHPEHFLNPPGRRGRRSRNLQDESSDDDEEPIAKQTISDKEEHIGKVVCVEITDSKKKGPKENWFPGLVVAPTAQDTVRIRVKDEYLVRSFKDGRYYTVPKKEAAEFTKELGQKQDNSSVSAALEYLNKDSLPPHWDRDTLFGLIASSSDYEQDFLSDSSDDEPTEEKDRFVAQLYKFMDDRGTPLNKGPSIINRDVDLYRLFRAVQKLGGYNRVTSQNQWKSIALRLGFSPATASITSLVKQAYKKFLHSFEEFNRKLGCTMISHPRSNRTKGRSLVRASSVASPKLIEVREIHKASTSTSVVVTPVVIASEDSESAEPTPEPPKSKRRLSTSSIKVKAMVEKIEEKVKEKEKEKEKPIVLKEDTPTPTPALISTPSTSAKKEKVVKKIDPEKRGRKKKDSDAAEKKEKEPSTSSETQTKPSIIPASASIAAAPAPAIQAIGDFPIEVGDKLKVFYHENKVTYEAKVLEISYLTQGDGEHSYLVHYNGWNQRYDEWVKKDRIAENLTKDKPKKVRTGVKQEKGPPPSSSNSLQTPSTKSKRGGRMRGDTTNSSRSTTPLSNASASRTKSPATSAHHRRITRGKTGNTRRTSNNTDISSLRSDSDTDSDEPIKKPSTSSQSSSNQKQDEKINKSSSSDFSSNEKARGYDLSQIRAELKGIKDLKGDAAAHATKSEDEKSTKSAKSSLKPGFDVKSKLKQDFEDPCSISSSDSCGATASDSDSSNVPSDVPNSSKSADTSEPEMEFKEKMERPSASKGSKWSEKRFDPEDEVKSVNNKKENSSKSEVSAAPSKNSTFFEKIIAGQASEKPEAKAATSKFETTKKASIYAEKAATSRALSAGEGKIGKFGPAEKTPAKETKATPQKLKESKDHKDVKDKSKISSDIYEFKDNEEFSESAGSTVASKKPPDLLLKETAPTTPSTSESEPKLSKKAQLIAQRKQAQAAAQPLYKQFQQQAMQQQQQQIAASLQQDDVEAHIKTSIVTVPTTGKKRKKSLGKDEKTPPSKPAPASKKELIVAEDKPEKIEKKLETPPQKVTPSPQTSGGKSGPAGQRTPKSIPKPESTFDVLRKSPNFNMALQLKEEAAAAAQLAAAQLGMEYNSKADIFSQATPVSSNVKQVKAMLFSSETLTELEKSKLLKPIALPTDVLKGDRTDSEDDLKHSSELENVQKILADPSFDLDPPKIEKPSSIADKVLKALNQIDANEKKSDKKVEVAPSTSKLPAVLKVDDPVTALNILSNASSNMIKNEMPKVEPLVFKQEFNASDIKPPAALIIPSPNATLKPILASPEHKDILESITPKNNDLSETIQKLESVIQKSTPIDRFPEDSSDSTDSEHRLVIEDESQGSEPPGANSTSQTVVKKPAMGVLESIMMEIPYKGNPSPAPSASSKDKESTDKNQEILTESTNDGSNNETISLLLCEETIPGSPAPAAVKDPLSDSSSKRSSFENPPQNQFIPPQNISSSSSAMKSSNIMTALQHQQQQLTASLSTTTNLKQIPMDIDTEITSSTGNPGMARMKLERGSTNSSGNNTNNNSDNSPRDSISQSDSEKIENISPKKRKRTRKASDSEAQHKRRRAHLRTANRSHNDSDSEDNSDLNAFTRSAQGSSRPSQYNFLVQLDPGMSGQQRIVVLKKKIQELRKTYNMLKSELASIDRRRKKFRRRERENKKNVKVA